MDTNDEGVLTVKVGLQAARARGRKGGHRHKLTAQQIEGKTLAADPKPTVQDICQTLGIGKMTYYRYIHNPIKN